MLLGSILTNVEVAYNLAISEIDHLEKSHEMALRKLLNLPAKTPKPMLYFMTGSTPVHSIVKRRRLVYLNHILNQGEESLVRTFFDCQLETRKPKDWASQIMKDLSDFKIEHSMNEIKMFKEEAWKTFVKEKSISYTINYLNSKVGSKSRTYTELKMSKFLSSHNEDTPIETAQFIAKVQTHMIETVKINFKEAYKPNFVCKSCNLVECNQSHLLYCSKLIGSNSLVSYIPEYQDIFNDDDPKEQCYIASLMMENLQKKKQIEDNI